MMVATAPLAGLRRFLRDILDYLEGTAIEEIIHLFSYLVPRAAGIIAEEQANKGEQHEDERRKGKNRVIGERGTELRRLVLQPLLKGLFQ